MIECGNCGGNLKYDIPSQMLKCEHCGSVADPYSIMEQEDAEMQSFETTEYTCPQCGGKIYANDTSAAEFCVYCGGSTILTGQISNEKRPDYVLPFIKTKEDCKKAYKKTMRRALFAPRELKDPENLDRFRGIYIPYWSYHISQNGVAELKGTKVKTKGNVETTEHYKLTCDLEGDYLGMSHDASSVFDDEITECLAPYDVTKMKKFHPAFLSGFYADVADVASKTYDNWAMEIVNDCAFSTVEKAPGFRKYKVTRPNSNAALIHALKSKQMPPDSTMYPVWFMTYRKGDRLLYATVNGQTGKVVADIPIDYGKYIIGTVILAIPIFLLLNIIFTFRPMVTLILATALSLVAAIAFCRFKKKLSDRENHVNDKGYKNGKSGKQLRAAKKAEKAARRENEAAEDEIIIDENTEKAAEKTGTESEKKPRNKAITIGMAIAIMVVASLVITSFGIFPKLMIGACVAVVAVINMFLLYYNWENPKDSLPLILLSVTPALSTLILLIRPVADLWYYAGTIILFGVILFSNLEIIKKYNLFSTRSIPSLHDRGGQNNE